MSKIINYKYLIVIVGLLSVAQITLTPITYDEAYYWVYSNFLSLGYYDHPPMVAVLIRTGEVFGHGVFFTRIAFLLMGLATLYLMTKMVEDHKKPLVILLFFLLPLLSSSMIFALPDTPLLFFSVLLWYLTEKYKTKDTLTISIFIGLTISALFYSKYHGLLIVIFTLLPNRELLKRKSFYLIILITIITYSPHIYWQLQNDFVSFKFHLFGRREKHFDISNILNYVAGVIFTCGFIWPFWLLLQKRIRENLKTNSIYFYNSVIFMGFIFLMSFRNQIELNWIVTASAAFILWVLKADTKISFKKSLISLAPILLIVISFRLLLVKDFGFSKSIDRLNEIHGWDSRMKKFKELDINEKVVFDNYQYGALFSYYLNELYPVEHIRSRESHYSILNLVEKYNIMETDPITFVGTKNVFNSYRIETGYKDPVYIEINTSIKEIKDRYKK